MMVLAIRRHHGDFVGVPQLSEVLGEGDLLVLYGKDEGLSEVCGKHPD